MMVYPGIQTDEKINPILRRLLRLSYPILGQLSNNVQFRLEKKYGKNNQIQAQR